MTHAHEAGCQRQRWRLCVCPPRRPPGRADWHPEPPAAQAGAARFAPAPNFCHLPVGFVVFFFFIYPCSKCAHPPNTLHPFFFFFPFKGRDGAGRPSYLTWFIFVTSPPPPPSRLSSAKRRARGGGCVFSEWWRGGAWGKGGSLAAVELAAPIVGKWLHVKQQILCPCCSSVIDLTSSRGVENFKGGSGCWRSGREHNQLVMHPLCLLPLLLLLLQERGGGVGGLGVRGRALRSLKYIQSINKMQTLWREGGERVGSVNAPESNTQAPDCTFSVSPVVSKQWHSS